MGGDERERREQEQPIRAGAGREEEAGEQGQRREPDPERRGPAEEGGLKRGEIPPGVDNPHEQCVTARASDAVTETDRIERPPKGVGVGERGAGDGEIVERKQRAHGQADARQNDVGAHGNAPLHSNAPAHGNAPVCGIAPAVGAHGNAPLTVHGNAPHCRTKNIE